MQNNHDIKPTLVLGGTGKTGRRVAERLTALGRPVRIGSRSAIPPFDWEDETTWPEALHGIAAAYVVYYPDLGFPEGPAKVGAFARMAVAQGVQRLVLLSGRGEEAAQESELALQQSGADWTVLRASWFAQNFSESYLLEPVLSGVIALPADDVPEPFLDVDDIADVAVVALTEEGHAGRVYELTGPRLLTFADVAAELTQATGRDVGFLPVTAEEYAVAAMEAGLPVEEIEPLTDLFTRVLDGRNAYLTHDVEQVLGRPARDFAEYARGRRGDRRLERRCSRGGRPMMIDGTPRAITLVAAIGSGLVGGVFFAFSSFVMPALRRLPDDQGISAMQAINKAAPTPLFMTALFGTAAVSLVGGRLRT